MSNDEFGQLAATFNLMLDTFDTLAAAAKAVSAGELGAPLELPGDLPDAFRSMLAQLIPEDKQTDKLSLGARFSTIVGILNEVNKAQLKIEMTSEIRELGSGDSAEVTALYIGISQAYYATADGRYAGKGTGTEQGWVWTPANDAAPEIAKAIAILQSEEGAAFVKLPLQVD